MKNISLFLLTLLVLASCDDAVDPGDLPYVEQLVIRGSLEAGCPVRKILIYRTQPPEEEFDYKKATISNARAVIKCDGKEYTLKYKNYSAYDAEDLVVESGRTYEITVEWNGKKAWASTYVPYPVEITQVYKQFKKDTDRDSLYHLIYNTFFRPKEEAVYLCGLADSSTYWYDNISFDYILYSNSDEGPDGLISDLIGYDSRDTIPMEHYNWYVIASFDPEFRNYFLSQNISDSKWRQGFSISGRNVKWNVRGDGIGEFIGVAFTRYRMF